MRLLFKHSYVFGGGGAGIGWMWSQGHQADIWAPGGVSALLWAVPLLQREAVGICIGVPPGPCGAPSGKDPGELREETKRGSPVCLFIWGTNKQMFISEVTFRCLYLFDFGFSSDIISVCRFLILTWKLTVSNFYAKIQINRKAANNNDVMFNRTWFKLWFFKLRIKLDNFMLLKWYLKTL